MRIVGYHISDKSIASSDGEELLNGTQCFEGLLKPKEDSIRILYHLEFSTANLLRLAGVTEKEGSRLLHTTRLGIPPYRLRYVQNKFLSLKRVGAFAYFSNAGQYTKFPNNWLLKDPAWLASKAKEVGEHVYEALRELGMEATSLTNPFRIYEKNIPLGDLAQLIGREKTETDSIKKTLLRKIMLGMIEKDLEADLNSSIGISPEPAPVTLGIAVTEGRWRDLGRLVRE